MLTVKEIVKASNGILVNGDEKVFVISYKLDSRETNKNDFFIPIVGEQNDAHKYILDLVKVGIIGFFVEKNNENKQKIISESKEINKDICIIEIENSEKALYDIAKYNREMHLDIPLVAVTGSVGKTSTKEMISSILSTEYNILKTEKNYNGYIGLSLMLLKLENQDIAVLEHGIDRIGEMEELVTASKPNIAVVTNIGTSHIGKFGSREKIFIEKTNISMNMNTNNFLILNFKDEYLKNYVNDKVNIVGYSSFNIQKESKANKTVFKANIYGNEENIEINELGDHNIDNALCAIKVAEIFKVKKENIIKGINEYRNFSRRFEKIMLKDNITLIDDSYNASIDSVMSGLKTLQSIESKRKIAVLGDMLELGENSKYLHEQIYENIVNIDIVILIGNEIKYTYNKITDEGIEKYIYSNIDEGIQKIKEIISNGDLIYIKASNGMNFNKIVKQLVEYKGKFE